MPLTPEKRAAILAAPSARAAVMTTGVPRTTVRRVRAAAAAAERIKPKVRTAGEFGAAAVKRPRHDAEIFSWILETIRAARDAQMRGDFKLAVKLANMMRTDDALFIAYHNRIAPQNAIAAELVSAGGARGDAVRKRAGTSVTLSRSTLAGACGTLANHGIAVLYNEHEPNEDASAIDFRVTEWPLEHVRWNPWTEQLETIARDSGVRVPIVHGDGRWTIVRKFLEQPWKQEAAVLPGALIWAAHAGGVRDMAAASFSHGNAKLLGELPEGVAMQNADGLTREASAFLSMLQDMVSGEAGAGLRPFGAKTEWEAVDSTQHQIFVELITDRAKAAARIYLGTDAILGSVGGAPGVDISQLFGVASTKIQGDFEALQEAARVGVYEPWTAINVGDSRLAPRLVYAMPDPDEAQREEHYAKADVDLMAAIKSRKELGLVVDQTEVDALAKRFGVPAPRLLPPAAPAPAATRPPQA